MHGVSFIPYGSLYLNILLNDLVIVVIFNVRPSICHTFVVNLLAIVVIDGANSLVGFLILGVDLNILVVTKQISDAAVQFHRICTEAIPMWPIDVQLDAFSYSGIYYAD